jgi:hypothetical protein
MAEAVVQPKWALKSVSIWSTIVASALMAFQVAGPIVNGLGVDVPVTPKDIQDVGNLGSNLIVATASVATFFAGLWGRFRAGKVVAPVSMVPNAAPVKVHVPTTRQDR